MNDLFNRPNLEIAADVATVQPVLDVNLVTTGTVIHKGYTSMVTAGPKTGFGLIPLDGGIRFYSSQSMFFVTLIHDFQQRMAQDPQGQKATQLYDFTARTYDWSNLTVTKTITPDGLRLSPSLTHNIDAVICSAPTQGNGLKRGIAALIGMNQDKITEKVKEGALPRFRQEIPQESLEEALERGSVEQAKRNADLRSTYLPGNDTAQVGDFLIKQLSMASRPEAIYVGGRFEWRGAPDQRGADMPRPPRLASAIEPGVTADLHLGSLLTSAAGGIWQQDRFRSVQNVMIQTKAVPPGTPPKDAVEVRENVSFADYIKAVDATRNAHDPRVQALRITRPQQPPEFSTDARGYLVALVRDFQVDAPAPDRQSGGAMLGVPAKVLRFKAPLVEVALSYQLDQSTPGSLHLKGKIQAFNPGTGGEVLAINDDEDQARPLNRFQSAIAMTALGAGCGARTSTSTSTSSSFRASRSSRSRRWIPRAGRGSTWCGRAAPRCSKPNSPRTSCPARPTARRYPAARRRARPARRPPRHRGQPGAPSRPPGRPRWPSGAVDTRPRGRMGEVLRRRVRRQCAGRSILHVRRPGTRL